MLRGVVVGCGFFSRIQMEAWRRVEGVRMAAACDLDAEKLASFAAEFDLTGYDDLAKMLDAERPDFVDVVTRPSTHRALVGEIAARGLPILLQKPIAESWEEAVEIVRIARAAGIRLMINENWRRQPWYRRIAEEIASGRLGRPFGYAVHSRARDGLGPTPYPNQPYFKDMPRLIVFETLVHHLDTARFLFGDIEEVYCRLRRINTVIRGEDAAWILVSHGSGVQGVIDGNRACEPDEPGPALETARFECLDGVLRLRHSGEVRLGDKRIHDPAGLTGYRGDSCRATQQHFADCLQNGREFESEAADYLRRTFAAVEACYRSAELNRPVRPEEIAAAANL